MNLLVKAHMQQSFGYVSNMPKNNALRLILAQNVDTAMKALGMTQTATAVAARKKIPKFNQTTVGHVLRADTPAGVDTIEAIAQALRVEPWLLFIPDGTDKQLLAVLKAWSVSSASGRELLLFAAEAAMKRNDDRKSDRGTP